MSTHVGVFIRDRRSGEYVDAILIDGVSREEVVAANLSWKSELQNALWRRTAEKTPTHHPEHSHWDWQKKYDATKDLLIYQMLGVKCAGEMQGLILLRTGNRFCRMPSQYGKGLVEVMFLATAPWNTPSITEEPRYSQVGTVLLASAIQISMDLEFSGRIGLHALPQAEKWYSGRCGMTDLGPDPNYNDLKYFEMTPEQASKFLL